MFFTTKDAARVVGCTVRQLQYWRAKGLVVPVVNPAGTGYSAYYDGENLVDLAIVHYLLQRGYDFQAAGEALRSIKSLDEGYVRPENARRFLMRWDSSAQKLVVEEFESEVIENEITKHEFCIIVMPIDSLHKRINQRIGNNHNLSHDLVMDKLIKVGWNKIPHSIMVDERVEPKFELPSMRKRRFVPDYILNYGDYGAIAVVEVSAIYMQPEDGLKQAMNFGALLGLSFAYATNGEEIIEYDFAMNLTTAREEFPTPEELWQRLKQPTNSDK